MARAKITYVYNPVTGKRDWHIHYESPGDATMHEHETKHRKLVREIVGDLESPDVDVERGEAHKPEKPPVSNPVPNDPNPLPGQKKTQ